MEIEEGDPVIVSILVKIEEEFNGEFVVQSIIKNVRESVWLCAHWEIGKLGWGKLKKDLKR